MNNFSALIMEYLYIRDNGGPHLPASPVSRQLCKCFVREVGYVSNTAPYFTAPAWGTMLVRPMGWQCLGRLYIIASHVVPENVPKVRVIPVMHRVLYYWFTASFLWSRDKCNYGNLCVAGDGFSRLLWYYICSLLVWDEVREWDGWARGARCTTPLSHSDHFKT